MAARTLLIAAALLLGAGAVRAGAAHPAPPSLALFSFAVSAFARRP